jgi:hypothetical protein
LHIGNGIDASIAGFNATTPGTYSATSSDPNTLAGGDIILVAVQASNSPPAVSADNGSVAVNEGQTAANTGTYSDPNAGDTVAISASVGTVTKTGTDSGTWSWSLGTTDGPAQSQTVTITADDGNGGTTQTTFALTVDNVAPTASLGNNGPINEGGSASVSFSGASDPSSVDSASLHYAFDCSGGSLAAATYAGSGTSDSTSCSFADNGSYTVSGKIMDKDGGSNKYTTTVTVNNVAPTLTSITGPVAPVPAGTGTSITLAFTDPAGSLDNPYSVQVNWDDGGGFVAAGTLTYAGGSINHTYATAGVYYVCAKVTDKDGGVSNTLCFEYIIVFDASAGFVTGGGWINSPAGAYAADLSLTGKANFGFVSKYKKGATVPTGETEFQFQAGSFNFHSDAYQWLVISGSCKAQYKGTGSVNGVAGYGFLLTATDGDACSTKTSDKFRIKVWKLSDSSVVYDNKMGTSTDIDAADPQAIAGGQIVIHK